MKTRIISGAIALILLAVLICLHSTVFFNIAFGLVGALMVYEVNRAEKIENEYVFMGISAFFAFITPLLVWFVPNIGPLISEVENRFERCAAWLSAVTVPYIVAAFAYIVIITWVLLARHKTISVGSFYACASYTLLISSCMCALCGIVKIFNDASVIYLVFTFMGAWVSDSGAYFVGTFFGKHKLCPSISPKKTVEGLIGGAITNALAFAALALFANNYLLDIKLRVSVFAIIGVICCILGLLGDLTASLIKRECGIKDYGNIMPGHGGAMDRFDSVVYIAPFMLFVLTIGSEIVWIS